jgi:hypothetical protein
VRKKEGKQERKDALEEARMLRIRNTERHRQRCRVTLRVCGVSKFRLSSVPPRKTGKNDEENDVDAHSPAGEITRFCSSCRILAMEGFLSFVSGR